MKSIKSISVFLMILVIANMVLFALKKVSGTTFWTVIILIGAAAYFALPKIR